MREKLDPTKVAAAVAFLVHEECPLTRLRIRVDGPV
jgi:hypothetical protein